MWSDTLTFQAKDRTLRILDPRTDGAANETKSHDGIKDSKVNWDVRWCEVKITPWGSLVICTSKVGWEDGDQLFSFGAQLWSGIPYAVVFAWFAFVNHQSDWWVCHQSDMWHVVGDLENDQSFQSTGFLPKQWISMIAENCGFVLHACRRQSAVNTIGESPEASI